MDKILQGLQIANEVFKIPVGVQEYRAKQASANVNIDKASGISNEADLVSGGFEKVNPADLEKTPQIIPYAPDYTGERQMLPAKYYGPKPTLLPVRKGENVELVPVVKTDDKNKFFTDESALTKDYEGNAITKNTNEVFSAGTKALDILNKPGAKFGADDLAVVYAFGKLNDPSSAVREGELELARKSQGLMGQLNSYIDGLKSGEILGSDGRSRIKNTIEQLMATQLELQKRIDAKYGLKAEDRGFKKERVVTGVWEDQQKKQELLPQKAEPKKSNQDLTSEIAKTAEIARAEEWLAKNPTDPRFNAVKAKVERDKRGGK
jgi:hypothetical protein